MGRVEKSSKQDRMKRSKALSIPEVIMALQNNSRLATEVLSTIKDDHIKEVLVRRCGIGRNCETLAQIGSSFGLTRERIRQIEEKGLRLICYKSRLDIIKDFLVTQKG